MLTESLSYLLLTAIPPIVCWFDGISACITCDACILRHVRHHGAPLSTEVIPKWMVSFQSTSRFTHSHTLIHSICDITVAIRIECALELVNASHRSNALPISLFLFLSLSLLPIRSFTFTRFTRSLVNVSLRLMALPFALAAIWKIAIGVFAWLNLILRMQLPHIINCRYTHSHTANGVSHSMAKMTQSNQDTFSSHRHSAHVKWVRLNWFEWKAAGEVIPL